MSSDSFGRTLARQLTNLSIITLNALHVLWLRHLRDCLHFSRIRLQALVRQEMSQEIHFAHPQLHLASVKDNAVVFAPLKEIL